MISWDLSNGFSPTGSRGATLTCSAWLCSEYPDTTRADVDCLRPTALRALQKLCRPLIVGGEMCGGGTVGPAVNTGIY